MWVADGQTLVTDCLHSRTLHAPHKPVNGAEKRRSGGWDPYLADLGLAIVDL